MWLRSLAVAIAAVTNVPYIIMTISRISTDPAWHDVNDTLSFRSGVAYRIERAVLPFRIGRLDRIDSRLRLSMRALRMSDASHPLVLLSVAWNLLAAARYGSRLVVLTLFPRYHTVP